MTHNPSEATPTASAVKLLGTSAARQSIEEDIDCAARSDAKVLITGESGVGKEVVARLIHERSTRSHRTFVAINCAGLPDSLLESELFGHERGAFTGADRNRAGMLEVANHGTLLLDEVGEMSMRMQALLLRFLETGEIQRLGAGAIERRVNVRVLAATNRVLMDRVKEGEFRADLYYRLNVIHILIPPLRDRREDVDIMIRYFLRKQSQSLGRPAPELASDVMARLLEYDWPGNVRELKNILERLIVRSQGGLVGLSELPPELRPSQRPQQEEHRQSSESGETPSLGDVLLGRMLNGGESFWQVVYEPLMSRDLTRATVREIVASGLERTQGSYRLLVELFNMRAGDYKRFLNMLRKLDCHIAFQPFRVVRASKAEEESDRPSLTRT